MPARCRAGRLQKFGLSIYNSGLHNSKYEETSPVIIAIEWRASLERTRTEW